MKDHRSDCYSAKGRIYMQSLKEELHPGLTSVAKDLPAMQEMEELQVRSLGRKISWKRKRQPTPVFLPGKSYGQRSLTETLHGVANSQTQYND